MLWLLFFSVLGIAAVICVYSFHTCFYSGKGRAQDPYAPIHGAQGRALSDQIYRSTREFEAAPFQPITIPSFDGRKLYGRLYLRQEGAPVEIVFHGYRSFALRDCFGAFAMTEKMGFNLIVPDQRAHGKSQGNVISFGILERRDCLCWAEFARQRFGRDTPIILSGISMGATTVLMSTELSLPENVCCVIADCPFSSPGEIIRKVSRDRGFSDRIFYPFIRLSAWLLGGFHLQESDAVTAVGKSKLPILLIHGEQDGFVPWDMSRQIYAAGKNHTQLEIFPNADHGMSYLIDPERYAAVVSAFLRRIPALQDALVE